MRDFHVVGLQPLEGEDGAVLGDRRGLDRITLALSSSETTSTIELSLNGIKRSLQCGASLPPLPRHYEPTTLDGFLEGSLINEILKRSERRGAFLVIPQAHAPAYLGILERVQYEVQQHQDGQPFALPVSPQHEALVQRLLFDPFIISEQQWLAYEAFKEQAPSKPDKRAQTRAYARRRLLTMPLPERVFADVEAYASGNSEALSWLEAIGDDSVDEQLVEHVDSSLKDIASDAYFEDWQRTATSAGSSWVFEQFERAYQQSVAAGQQADATNVIDEHHYLGSAQLRLPAGIAEGKKLASAEAKLKANDFTDCYYIQLDGSQQPRDHHKPHYVCPERERLGTFVFRDEWPRMRAQERIHHGVYQCHYNKRVFQEVLVGDRQEMRWVTVRARDAINYNDVYQKVASAKPSCPDRDQDFQTLYGEQWQAQAAWHNDRLLEALMTANQQAIAVQQSKELGSLLKLAKLAGKGIAAVDEAAIQDALSQPPQQRDHHLIFLFDQDMVEDLSQHHPLVYINRLASQVLTARQSLRSLHDAIIVIRQRQDELLSSDHGAFIVSARESQAKQVSAWQWLKTHHPPQGFLSEDPSTLTAAEVFQLDAWLEQALIVGIDQALQAYAYMQAVATLGIKATSDGWSFADFHPDKLTAEEMALVDGMFGAGFSKAQSQAIKKSQAYAKAQADFIALVAQQQVTLGSASWVRQRLRDEGYIALSTDIGGMDNALFLAWQQDLALAKDEAFTLWQSLNEVMRQDFTQQHYEQSYHSSYHQGADDNRLLAQQGRLSSSQRFWHAAHGSWLNTADVMTFGSGQTFQSLYHIAVDHDFSAHSLWDNSLHLGASITAAAFLSASVAFQYAGLMFAPVTMLAGHGITEVFDSLGILAKWSHFLDASGEVSGTGALGRILVASGALALTGALRFRAAKFVKLKSKVPKYAIASTTRRLLSSSGVAGLQYANYALMSTLSEMSLMLRTPEEGYDASASDWLRVWQWLKDNKGNVLLNGLYAMADSAVYSWSLAGVTAAQRSMSDTRLPRHKLVSFQVEVLAFMNDSASASQSYREHGHVGAWFAELGASLLDTYADLLPSFAVLQLADSQAVQDRLRRLVSSSLSSLARQDATLALPEGHVRERLVRRISDVLIQPASQQDVRVRILAIASIGGLSLVESMAIVRKLDQDRVLEQVGVVLNNRQSQFNERYAGVGIEILESSSGLTEEQLKDLLASLPKNKAALVKDRLHVMPPANDQQRRWVVDETLKTIAAYDQLRKDHPDLFAGFSPTHQHYLAVLDAHFMLGHTRNIHVRKGLVLRRNNLHSREQAQVILDENVAGVGERSGEETLTDQRRRFVEEFNDSTGSLWAQVVEEFETVRLMPSVEFAQPRALVIALHGFGANTSRALAMTNVMLNLGSADSPASGSVREQIRLLPNSVPLAVEAIDLPGHGLGPSTSHFSDRGSFASWLAGYVESRRKHYGGIPVILLARSASADFAVSTGRDAQETIDGFVFINPTMPGDVEAMELSEAALRSLADDEVVENGVTLKINEDGFNWAKGLLLQGDWQEENFQGKPTLFLVGGKDPELSDGARSKLETLADQHGHVAFGYYARLGHDALSTSGLSRGQVREVVRAFQEVFNLVHAVEVEQARFSSNEDAKTTESHVDPATDSEQGKLSEDSGGGKRSGFLKRLRVWVLTTMAPLGDVRLSRPLRTIGLWAQLKQKENELEERYGKGAVENTLRSYHRQSLERRLKLYEYLLDDVDNMATQHRESGIHILPTVLEALGKNPQTVYGPAILDLVSHRVTYSSTREESDPDIPFGFNGGEVRQPSFSFDWFIGYRGPLFAPLESLVAHELGHAAFPFVVQGKQYIDELDYEQALNAILEHVPTEVRSRWDVFFANHVHILSELDIPATLFTGFGQGLSREFKSKKFLAWLVCQYFYERMARVYEYAVYRNVIVDRPELMTVHSRLGRFRDTLHQAPFFIEADARFQGSFRPSRVAYFWDNQKLDVAQLMLELTEERLGMVGDPTPPTGMVGELEGTSNRQAQFSTRTAGVPMEILEAEDGLTREDFEVLVERSPPDVRKLLIDRLDAMPPANDQQRRWVVEETLKTIAAYDELIETHPEPFVGFSPTHEHYLAVLDAHFLPGHTRNIHVRKGLILVRNGLHNREQAKQILDENVAGVVNTVGKQSRLRGSPEERKKRIIDLTLEWYQKYGRFPTVWDFGSGPGEVGVNRKVITTHFGNHRKFKLAVYNEGKQRGLVVNIPRKAPKGTKSEALIAAEKDLAIELTLKWIAAHDGEIPIGDEFGIDDGKVGVQFEMCVKHFGSSQNFWLAVYRAGQQRGQEVNLARVTLRERLPSYEFRNIQREQAVDLARQWQKNHYGKRPKKPDFGRGKGKVGVSYDRCMGVGRYGANGTHRNWRFFDSPKDFWAAFDAKVKAEFESETHDDVIAQAEAASELTLKWIADHDGKIPEWDEFGIDDGKVGVQFEMCMMYFGSAQKFWLAVYRAGQQRGQEVDLTRATLRGEVPSDEFRNIQKEQAVDLAIRWKRLNNGGRPTQPDFQLDKSKGKVGVSYDRCMGVGRYGANGTHWNWRFFDSSGDFWAAFDAKEKQLRKLRQLGFLSYQSRVAQIDTAADFPAGFGQQVMRAFTNALAESGKQRMPFHFGQTRFGAKTVDQLARELAIGQFDAMAILAHARRLDALLRAAKPNENLQLDSLKLIVGSRTHGADLMMVHTDSVPIFAETYVLGQPALVDSGNLGDTVPTEAHPCLLTADQLIPASKGHSVFQLGDEYTASGDIRRIGSQHCASSQPESYVTIRLSWVREKDGSSADFLGEVEAEITQLEGYWYEEHRAKAKRKVADNSQRYLEPDGSAFDYNDERAARIWQVHQQNLPPQGEQESEVAYVRRLVRVKYQALMQPNKDGKVLFSPRQAKQLIRDFIVGDDPGFENLRQRLFEIFSEIAELLADDPSQHDRLAPLVWQLLMTAEAHADDLPQWLKILFHDHPRVGRHLAEYVHLQPDMVPEIEDLIAYSWMAGANRHTMPLVREMLDLAEFRSELIDHPNQLPQSIQDRLWPEMMRLPGVEIRPGKRQNVRTSTLQTFDVYETTKEFWEGVLIVDRRKVSVGKVGDRVLQYRYAKEHLAGLRSLRLFGVTHVPEQLNIGWSDQGIGVVMTPVIDKFYELVFWPGEDGPTIELAKITTTRVTDDDHVVDARLPWSDAIMNHQILDMLTTLAAAMEKHRFNLSSIVFGSSADPSGAVKWFLIDAKINWGVDGKGKDEYDTRKLTELRRLITMIRERLDDESP